MNKVYLVIYTDYYSSEGYECDCWHPNDEEIKAIFDSSEKAYVYIANIEVGFRKDYEVKEMEVQ